MSNSNSFTSFPYGTSGPVICSAMDSHGNLVVVGYFPTPLGSSQILNGVARFDGENWEPLGTGFNGYVESIVIDVNDNIYVGGQFTMDGRNQKQLSKIAKWDAIAQVWMSLGGGLNSNVNCLQILPNGNLIVGGVFTQTFDGSVQLNYLGIWDGSTWSTIGTGASGHVYCFKQDAENLFIGGQFNYIDGILVNKIAMWNGTTVSNLGDGFDSSVYAIEIDADDILIAGGSFTKNSNSTNTFNYIAQWDQNAWLPLGVGLNGPVKALKYRTELNLLYVGGHFSKTFDENVNLVRLGVWNKNANEWFADNNFYNSSGLAVLNFGYDRGGDFHINGEHPYAYSCAMNGQIKHSIIDNDGNLIVGGGFTASADFGILNFNRVAKWIFAKNKWQSFGPGVDNAVNAIALRGNGDIVIGGDFINTVSGHYTNPNYDVVTLNRIGIWNGVRWSPLGTGFNNTVHCAIFDSQDNLYVGGSFTSLVGGALNSMKYIAKWNGSSWSQLGAGVNGTVLNMKFDKYNNLIIVGHMTTVGNPSETVNYIAGWNGSSWFKINTGMTNGNNIYGFNGSVNTLNFDTNGNMYVGGQFTSISDNSIQIKHVCKITVSNSTWSTSTCSQYGDGLNNYVNVLQFNDGGILYAGGNFTATGNNSVAKYIAKCDGTTWSQISTGLNGPVFSISLNLNSEIIICGGFSSSNDNVTLSGVVKLGGKKRTIMSNFSFPIKYIGDAPFVITPPNSNRTGQITYTSSNNAIASISGTVITIKTGGQVTITATQTEDLQYAPGIITSTLTIQKITNNLPNFTIPYAVVGDPRFKITPPKSSSSGAFTYSSSNTGVATISGNMIRPIGVGQTTITATQASTTKYTSASKTTIFKVFGQIVSTPQNPTPLQSNTAISSFMTGTTSYASIATNAQLPSTNPTIKNTSTTPKQITSTSSTPISLTNSATSIKPI